MELRTSVKQVTANFLGEKKDIEILRNGGELLKDSRPLVRINVSIMVEKNGKKFVRKLNPDRTYLSKEGKKISLHGRALLLNRNVGHLMTSPAITLKDGSEIPEGIMDAFVSTMCALHDFKNKNNSRTGSIYIVKPKMHGPEEVAFTDKLFGQVEDVLDLSLIHISEPTRPY